MKPDNTRNVTGSLQAPRASQRLAYWIAALEAVLMFAFAGAAVVARAAGLATNAQLAGWVLAYILIALGTLVTAYEMARSR
jgi:hypothetical protein